MIDTKNFKLIGTGTSVEEDIRRCLYTLFSTREGAQPMDRSFGLNRDFVGKPLPVAQNEYAAEVIRKVAVYEPRVEIEEVTFEFDSDNGKMKPVIKFRKGDGGYGY